MAIVKHGVTANTPSNILLGAGTFYKGLTYGTNGWTGTILGATSGGGKVSIKGEFLDLEVDGALVKFKGQTIKVGGTATAEVTFAEVTTDIIKMGTLFEAGTSTSTGTGITMLQDKAHIEEDDYIANFGFVGETADGSKQVIIIFENAICTSGLEIEGKNKEQSVVKLTLEAVADYSGDLNTLPVKIYYVETSTSSGGSAG